MSSHRVPWLVCGLSLLLASVPLVALAQESLDTPELSVVSVGQGKVRLGVAAGPSGAPGGFTISWMRAGDFVARDRTWPNGASDQVVQISFTGVATLNTWGEATREYRLQPNESLDTEIGDLADETGVAGTTLGELGAGTEYVFRVSANGTATADASAPSLTLSGATLLQGHDCTYTQGYWRNHPADWPVESLVLGSVSYGKSQLLQILDGSVRGNGLVSLAHQIIAVKLNVAAGANPGDVAAALASADAAIGSLVVPPVGAGSLAPGSTSELTQVLDDYNNGVSGPGHCGGVPALAPSWGRLKDLYR